MKPPPRILIVGAGLAGLGLFRALQQAGITADLIERESASSGGAGIMLTGNALAALDRLGLGDRVREHGRKVSSVAFCEAGGDLLFRLDLPDRWPDFVSIERAQLRGILLEAIRPASPHWGCAPTAIEHTPEGVRVTHTSGKRGEYDLLVGADGVHSCVAELSLGLPREEALAGYFGWRFIVERPPELVEPIYMIGNGRTLLCHPLPDNRVYCGAGPICGIDELTPTEAPGRSALLEAFRDFAAPAAAVLAKVDAKTELIPTRYWQLERKRWRGDRTLLIGDAAHACVPTLAQGGAMAFEDGIVLAELLAESSSLDEALARFEERRRSRVQRVQHESLARLQANPILDDKRQMIRNRVMRSVGRERLQSAWEALVTTAP